MNRQQATSHSLKEGSGAHVAQDESLGPVPNYTMLSPRAKQQPRP